VDVGDKHYLARGELSTQTLTTIAPDVTNPALSPDGARVAFVRVDGGINRLALLDLRTRAVRNIGDQPGVSGQPVWFDDQTVGYVVRDDEGRPTIWSTGIYPGARPELVVDGAESPSPL
jgi:Tol biopolymer transport system component